MIRPTVRSTFSAGPDFVCRAVLVRAQVGAAAHHALGGAGFAGVVTIVRTLGIVYRLGAGREPVVIIMPVPIGTPLPDVAGHVGQPIAVGRERADRCRRAVAVFRGVLVRESSLPDVGHPLAVLA